MDKQINLVDVIDDVIDILQLRMVIVVLMGTDNITKNEMMETINTLEKISVVLHTVERME